MNTSQKFTIALIDLDGTLLNTKKAIDASLEHAFNFIGLDGQNSRVQQLAFEVTSIGTSLGQAAKKFWSILDLTEDIDPHTVVEEYRNHYAAVSSQLTEPFPGVTKALELLSHNHITLCVVTNKGEDAAKKALQEAHIIQYFSHFITDRPGISPKPNPQSYREILAPSLGFPDPQEVIMVGDTATDILYAKAIGIRSCWVSYGYGALDRIQKSAPDFIAHTPAEWAKIILGEK